MYQRAKQENKIAFFNSISWNNYIAPFQNEMKHEIERMTDADISACDLKEWAEYLADKYFIEPIEIYDENIESILTPIKIEGIDEYNGYTEYYEEEGCRITYKIPFSGNPNLFKIIPKYRLLSASFSTRQFIEPLNENCGSFTIDFEYPTRIIQNKGDKLNDYVKDEFEREFNNYKKTIECINNEVQSYDNNLYNYAYTLLVERKKKADFFVSISNTLQIPLPMSKNAPNLKPIHLKRVIRKPKNKPIIHFATPEYCVSDTDYENINNIIWTFGTSMEKTARTYYDNVEEELRDLFIATLNTHYETVTGETFRKIGKTDIQIEFENKAAFIAECKIWHGEQLFKEAIQQLINYLTWKDLKISLIIFNKENKSFFTILSKIKEWSEENCISYTKPRENVCECVYYREDMDMNIKLTILVFDLYVDKSQFKDKHKRLN